MKVENLTLLPTYPFDKYLKLPGWSHSKIKSEGRPFKTPTIKMEIGTKVHQYLLEPYLYNHDDEHIVKPVAKAIRNKLGMLWKYLEPELAFTADFIHNDFRLPYQGRADLSIVGKIVVDIKITEQPISKGVEYFGYDNAISGYCKALGAKVGLIVAGNPKTGQVSIYNVPIKTDWWEYQIVEKGEPIL